MAYLSREQRGQSDGRPVFRHAGALLSLPHGPVLQVHQFEQHLGEARVAPRQARGALVGEVGVLQHVHFVREGTRAGLGLGHGGGHETGCFGGWLSRRRPRTLSHFGLHRFCATRSGDSPIHIAGGGHCTGL